MGSLVHDPDMDASHALHPRRGGAPTVLLNPELDLPGYDSISIANVDGARAMMRHLLELGHRRIATITGPERNIDARQRLEGYRAALRDAGLEPSPELEVVGDFTERSGYEGATALLKRGPRPDAIVVANDYMAVGALALSRCAGARARGRGRDRFDDVPLARYLTPPLTTVHVDMLRLGQCAVEMLLGPPMPSLPTAGMKSGHHLVVRRSCGSQPPRQVRGASNAVSRRRDPRGRSRS